MATKKNGNGIGLVLITISQFLSQFGHAYTRKVWTGIKNVGGKWYVVIAGADKNRFKSNATPENPARGIYNLADGTPRLIRVGPALKSEKEAQTASQVVRDFYADTSNSAEYRKARIKNPAALAIVNEMSAIVGRKDSNRATGGGHDLATYGQRVWGEASMKKQADLEAKARAKVLADMGYTEAQFEAQKRKMAKTTAK